MNPYQLEMENYKSIIKNFIDTVRDIDEDDVESTKKRILYRMIHHFYADGLRNDSNYFFSRSAKMIIKIEELSIECLIQEVKNFDNFMSNYARRYRKISKSIIIDIMNLNELILHESKD
jgi:hypothetical protein